MHGLLTKYTVDESGAFRRGEEGVFDGDRCIFMAPPAHLVPQLMDELFGWMAREKDSVHPLILSSVFHYEFVFIHPFADGNGRTGRLVMNYLLVLHSHPPIVIHQEDRKAYFEALEAWDEEQNLQPLKIFLQEQTVKTWEKQVLRRRR